MAFKREAVIKAAEKYVARGRIEAAIREYRKVLEDSPTDTSTLNRVGDLYARIERFDEAVRLFTQIAEHYTSDGFFVKAIAIYKKIIKLDPTALRVYEKLAALYGKQGLVTEARTQYQVLADYYQKHDNVASAITIYQRMAEMEPDNPSFRLKLADLYTSRSLTDKAMNELRLLAEIFVRGGSLDEAVQVFIRALDTNPDDLEFIEQAARLLQRHGNQDGAERILTRALDRNPEVAAIARGLGVALAGAEVATPEATTLDEVAEGAAEPIATDELPPLDEVALEVPARSLDDDALDVTLAASSTLDLDELESVALPTAGQASDVFHFDLDLDEDDAPSSLVKPPPDMVETEPSEAEASAVAAAEEVAEAVAKPAADPTEDPPIEIEIDWEFDGLEDEGTDAATGSVVETPALVAPADVAPEVEDTEVAPPGSMVQDDDVGAVPKLDLEATIAASPAAIASSLTPAVRGTPPAVSALHRQDDLFAEAQVFAKYGLRQKAEERLHELHERNPEHLGGWLLVTRMHLEAGQKAEVVNHANRVAMLSRLTGQLTDWDKLREELVYAGYPMDGDVVVGEPSKEERAGDNRISQFLELLDAPPESAPPESAPPVTKAASPVVADAASATLDQPAMPAPPPVEPEIPATVSDGSTDPLAGRPTVDSDSDIDVAVAGLVEAAPPTDRKVNLVEELGLDEGTASTPSPDPDAFDDSGMSWLDDTRVPTAEAAPAETIFDEEDDFFDLAAELERELSEEEMADGTAAVSQPEGQSLEEIVEGFKKGVAEHLSPEDYDTHFNLGIAYREMGLLDEAIGEFQLASKDARYLVESSSMLGICFLDKGLPELAIKWYRKGLASPAIREEETLGLLYEMGGVYSAVGDQAAARKVFVEIYGMDSGFRDVADCLKSMDEA